MRLARLTLRPILDSKSAPLLFLAAALLLNLLSNALYDIAKERASRPVAIAVLVLLLLSLIVIGYTIFSWLRHQLRTRLTVSDLTPRRGLIVLVSQGRVFDTPAAAAIRYHYKGEDDKRPEPTLEFCWLITSTRPPAGLSLPQGDPPANNTASAWSNAEELRKMYLGKVKMFIHEIDPEDPEDIFRTIDRVFDEARKQGFEQRELIADFTGGTKIMTVGMVLACTAKNRDLEYMKPRGFLEDGRVDPTAGADPKLVDLNFFLGAGRDEDLDS